MQGVARVIPLPTHRSRTVLLSAASHNNSLFSVDHVQCMTENDTGVQSAVPQLPSKLPTTFRSRGAVEQEVSTTNSGRCGSTHEPHRTTHPLQGTTGNSSRFTIPFAESRGCSCTKGSSLSAPSPATPSLLTVPSPSRFESPTLQ